MEKKINRNAFEVCGVTWEQYVDWCKSHERNPNLRVNKQRFFSRIWSGDIRIDAYGRLVEYGKYVKRSK